MKICWSRSHGETSQLRYLSRGFDVRSMFPASPRGSAPRTRSPLRDMPMSHHPVITAAPSLIARSRQKIAKSPHKSVSSLLIMLPLPVRYDQEGRLLFESQAANGLERWAENFEHVTVTCILTPEKKLQARSSWTWRPVAELTCASTVEVITLPWAFKPSLFIRHYRKTRKLLAGLIQRSNYLVFSICYTWGDWAALGCLEAIRQRRPYAVWTDLVDHRRSALTLPASLRLANSIPGTLMQTWWIYHHNLIQRGRLGLFHGRECYDAYAPYCPIPCRSQHPPEAGRRDRCADSRKPDRRDPSKRSLGRRHLGRADAARGGLDWLPMSQTVCLTAVMTLTQRGWAMARPGRPSRAGFQSWHQPAREITRLHGRSSARLSFSEAVIFSLLPQASRVSSGPDRGNRQWHADRRLRHSLPARLIGANGWGKLTPQHDTAALAGPSASWIATVIRWLKWSGYLFGRPSSSMTRPFSIIVASLSRRICDM